MADEHVTFDCRSGQVTRRPLTQAEIDARAARPKPTAADLAAQLDAVVGSTDRLELVLRAVVSLIADSRGITDAQAKAAVKQRAQQIAAGDRG